MHGTRVGNRLVVRVAFKDGTDGYRGWPTDKGPLTDSFRSSFANTVFAGINEIRFMLILTQGGTCCSCLEVTAFHLGTHEVASPEIACNLNLSLLEPVHGLSERFEDGRRRLEEFCLFLNDAVEGLDIGLVFDFNAYAPDDASELLACVRQVGLVKHMSIGFYTKHLPRGGKTVIAEAVRQAVLEQTRTPESRSDFANSSIGTSPSLTDLPQELLSAVLAYAVTNEELTHLRAPNDSKRSYLHAKQCCRKCRTSPMKSDQDCRCDGPDSFSSHCQCVGPTSGIFRVSRNIRTEALRLYWSNNIFLSHGWIGWAGTDRWHPLMRIYRTSVFAQIMSIPFERLSQIRRLVIDTDCPLRDITRHEERLQDGLEPHAFAYNHWYQVLDHLNTHGRPDLELEVRLSGLDVDVDNSFASEQDYSYFFIDRFNERTAAVGEWEWRLCFDFDCDEESRRFVEGIKALRYKIIVWSRGIYGRRVLLAGSHLIPKEDQWGYEKFEGR